MCSWVDDYSASTCLGMAITLCRFADVSPVRACLEALFDEGNLEYGLSQLCEVQGFTVADGVLLSLQYDKGGAGSTNMITASAEGLALKSFTEFHSSLNKFWRASRACTTFSVTTATPH